MTGTSTDRSVRLSDRASWMPSGMENVILLGVSALIAIVMFRPLVTQIATHIPQDLIDPLQETWQIAWAGHAVIEQPWDLFDGNVLWPHRNTLMFSDSILGYTPWGLAIGSPQEALVRYNLLFLFSYTLAFAGAYLLARQLGAGWAAASIAGAAFAYAPWKLGQNGHLHVLSSGAIPLAIFLLIRGYTRDDPWLVVAGWLIATWQLSLGFTLGIPFAYLLAATAIGGAFVAARRGWRPSKKLLAATGAGVAIFLGWAAFQAVPFLEIIERYPMVAETRTVEATSFFSPPPSAFLVAPSESILWAEATEEKREKLNWPVEQTLFPGLIAAVLGLVGLLMGAYSRGARLALGSIVLVSGVLSMGFAGGPVAFIYGFLYRLAPGWDVSRTPGRLTTITTLALGLLAAAGAEAIRGWSANRQPVVGRTGAFVLVVLCAGVLAEGAGRVPYVLVPPPPAAMAEPDPQLHLPSNDGVDHTYMYWSIGAYPSIINGALAFTPGTTLALREEVQSFPSARSVRILQRAGVETVLFHRDLVDPHPEMEEVTRGADRLPLQIRFSDDTVIYDIEETDD